MNIVISGYYGSKNGGDEAMLASMLEVLREEIPDLRVTVISIDPEYTKRRHGVDAVKRPDICTIIKKIRDLLISGGGSLLQNVTSGRSLYYYLAIIFFALAFGRKVMLYAQGIGPIRGVLAHKLMNLIINRVDLITVRDRGSLEELARLEITRPKIFCTADPVLAIKPAPLNIGEKILSRYVVGASTPAKLKSLGCGDRRKNYLPADEISRRYSRRAIDCRTDEEFRHRSRRRIFYAGNFKSRRLHGHSNWRPTARADFRRSDERPDARYLLRPED